MIILAVIDWAANYLARATCAIMCMPDMTGWNWDDLISDDEPEPDPRLQPVDIIDRIDALVNDQLTQGKQDKR